MDDYSMTKDDVAEHFGVTVRSVERWMARESDPIPYAKLPSGSVRFRLKRIEEWAESHIVGRVGR